MKDKDKDKQQQDQDQEKPSNDLVFCFECIITLDDIIEKLDYIGKYTSSNSEGVMSKAIGQQIENLMKKQKELELEFDNKIKEKSEKIDLVQENEINQLKDEIKKTAEQLKQSTNNICKSLAENPDIPKNLKKAFTDKEKIKEKLLIIKQDLVEGSFEKFKKISEDLKSSNINIQELRSRETELFKTLRWLNEKLVSEDDEYMKENKNLNHALNTRKKELANTKIEEEILREYRVNFLK